MGVVRDPTRDVTLMPNLLTTGGILAPGPQDLLGKWEQDGIRWPDSNKWSKASGSIPSSL